MKTTLIRTIITGAMMLATAASLATAAPLKLQLANPQPGGLKKGLAVSYGYAPQGQDIKSLATAAAVLKSGAKRGRALSGLDYRDTNEGDKTLTSDRAMNVAASIRGFIRFDAPGIYNIDFLTNDGLRARIGGQVVGMFDGRQPCETTRQTQVEVPQAGWYPLDATYFQRLGTACLHMRWAPQGQELDWVPDSAFGH